MTAALALRGIHKRFGAMSALEDASCVVRPGTVHAVLGENGAGKSTLMRIAFGMLPPDAGSIAIDGRQVELRSSADAIANGIGMVHQHLMLVPALTVAENVALGGHGRFDATTAAARVRRIGAETGLALDPEARVGDLPLGAQQRLEIVKALAHQARLLILDEPTALLTPTEAHELYRWLRRFVDAGGTAVLITHKLREALANAADITVLRRGRVVLTGGTDALDEEAVVTALVGTYDARPAVPLAPRHPQPEAPVILALRDAQYVDARGVRRLERVSLEVRTGEILGVLGVEGSGHHELLRLLAGRLAPTAGMVIHPPRVGFVPEDRLRDAVIPGMTLTENLVLATAGARRGLIAWREERARMQDIVTSFDVRVPAADPPLDALSGGNQQKFVVGRERALAHDALVAENPTRGLDLLAAARVREEITAASSHTAIVYHSSDLDEVLAIATRIAVCHAGTVREVPRAHDPLDPAPFARALVGAS